MTIVDYQNHYADMRVLVTGAGGFIGSHLVEALHSVGAKVRAFVHYNSRSDIALLKQLKEEVVLNLEIVTGDLCDPFAVQEAVVGNEIVFHLGALISIPYSYNRPYQTAQTNMMGSLNVLHACKVVGVRRLIHTSTSEVYGSALRIPIAEDHPLQGQSPYSASKIGADKLAESYYCAYDLPVVTLRPFNTYGPRQSDRAVIPTIISQAIWGERMMLGNLEARRDLTYVADTVDGFLKVGIQEGVEGGVINLGYGSDISIGELAAKITKLIGRDLPIVQDQNRLRPQGSEVNRLLSDNKRAKDLLGWMPMVDLDAGLNKTIVWIRNHPEFYRVGCYQF